MNNNGNRLPIIEALILSSPDPLTSKKIADVVQDITPGEIDDAVSRLNEKYLANDASFRIRKIAGGYQMFITENYSGYVEELFTRRRNQRLTRAALETLAIIAYRQPVTRVDIEMIRGVSSDSAIRTLMERKLITLSGRAQSIGRPLLYSTTDEFLKFFSLNSLQDLPKMEEIEELLSESEPDSQQSLEFEPGNGNSGTEPLPDETGQVFTEECEDVSGEADDEINQIQDAPVPSGEIELTTEGIDDQSNIELEEEEEAVKP